LLREVNQAVFSGLEQAGSLVRSSSESKLLNRNLEFEAVLRILFAGLGEFHEFFFEFTASGSDDLLIIRVVISSAELLDIFSDTTNLCVKLHILCLLLANHDWMVESEMDGCYAFFGWLDEC